LKLLYLSCRSTGNKLLWVTDLGYWIFGYLSSPLHTTIKTILLPRPIVCHVMTYHDDAVHAVTVTRLVYCRYCCPAKYMSQAHHPVSQQARPAARLAGTRGVVPRTSQTSSEPSDRSALALGVISTTLDALKEASGFAPVPALRHAAGLAIVLLESVQACRNVYIYSHSH